MACQAVRRQARSDVHLSTHITWPIQSRSPKPIYRRVYDLTVLPNFYDSTGILEPWIQRWVPSVEDKARATEETMVKGLLIGWEFGRKDTFTKIARRLLMESHGSEYPNIQTPPDIIEQISAIRISTIQALLDLIGQLISHLLFVDERPRWCRHAEWMGPHRCEPMILGSITFCLSRAGLWPLPKAEDVRDSIVGLHRKLKGLVIHDIGQVDGLDHTTCNPGPNLLSEVERIYTEISSPVTNFQAEKIDKHMKRLAGL